MNRVRDEPGAVLEDAMNRVPTITCKDGEPAYCCSIGGISGYSTCISSYGVCCSFV